MSKLEYPRRTEVGRKSLPFLRRRLQRLKTGPSHERVELVIANRAGFGQALKCMLVPYDR